MSPGVVGLGIRGALLAVVTTCTSQLVTGGRKKDLHWLPFSFLRRGTSSKSFSFLFLESVALSNRMDPSVQEMRVFLPSRSVNKDAICMYGAPLLLSLVTWKDNGIDGRDTDCTNNK